jgi:hypothetical protein
MHTLPPGVLSHWYKLVEGFQTSTFDFYDSVEEAIARRKIPDVEISRVEYGEEGMISARRMYLRVTRENLTFDICGAPFGTGFFFSWWLKEEVSWGVPGGCLFWFLWLGVFGYLTSEWGATGCLIGILFLVGAAWALVYVGRREWVLVPEDALIRLPLVGPFLEGLLKPSTYYRLDTTLMFQEAVRTAVLEVIDGLMGAKGLRALSGEERTPILQAFVRGARGRT